jgi:hypothetical protein
MKYDQIAEAYVAMLDEMAIPSNQVKDTVYYHGTYDNDDAKALEIVSNIAKNGIAPPNLEGTKNYNLRPVIGKTYSTPDIGYAQMYALGGDIAGTNFTNSNWKPKHTYGYVFAFHGKQLSDVQPDEDSIGELVGNRKGPYWLHQLANKHVAQSVIDKARDGEYHAYARIGKNLVNKMTDDQKLDLIHNHGAHVANTGNITPDRAYRIPMAKVHLLKRDGANFFDHGEELNMDDLKNGIHTVRRKRKPLTQKEIE